MSAVIEVTRNADGTWTARGSYGGVYAEATRETRHEAVVQINKAFELKAKS
ncbi:hypothetical protein K0038_02533 [Pseudomonas syringae]|nr:hypothetical protein [Pseudomonas syringae]